MARASSSVRRRPGGIDAWRRILPRLAEERLGLELAVLTVEDTETTLSGALAEYPEGSLLVSLESSGMACGLAIVDMQLLAALIEIQTTGRVSSSRREARPGTAADFELVAHIIDGWCAAMANAAGDGQRTLSCARLFPDSRAVLLGLDEGAFRETRLELELGGGRRTGVLRLIAPKQDKRGAAPDPAALRRTLLPLQANLHAVLCRVRMPLSRALALRAGEVIELGEVALRNISVEAPVGQVICRAHLGQSRGFRAVRILERTTEDEDEGVHPTVEGFDLTIGADSGVPQTEVHDVPSADAGDLPQLPDLPALLDAAPLD